MLNFGKGHGPRKYKSDYVLREVYAFYATKQPDPVSYKIWKELILKYNQAMMHHIIYDHSEWVLPKRLGTLRVKKKKKVLAVKEDGTIDKNRLKADWKKTKLMWEKKYPGKTEEEINLIPIEEKGIIYILNEHTEGYTFKFYWDRKASNVPQQNYYSFKVIRKYNRELAKALDTNPELQYYYFE